MRGLLEDTYGAFARYGAYSARNHLGWLGAWPRYFGRMASLFWAHGLDILGAWPRYIPISSVTQRCMDPLRIDLRKESCRRTLSTGFFAEIAMVVGYLQSLIALSFCRIISTVSPLVMNSTRLPVKPRPSQVTRTHTNPNPPHTNAYELMPTHTKLRSIADI